MTHEQSYYLLFLIVVLTGLSWIKDTIEQREELNRLAFVFLLVIAPLINQ